MIANRACSEAYRRDAERVGVANRKVQQLRLKEALTASEAALSYAKLLLTNKDALLVDIYIEHGSAWRDLARFYGQHPDLCEVLPVDPIQESQAWLQAAD